MNSSFVSPLLITKNNIFWFTDITISITYGWGFNATTKAVFTGPSAQFSLLRIISIIAAGMENLPRTPVTLTVILTSQKEEAQPWE